MIANKEEIRVGQVIVHILDSTVGMPVLSDTVLDYGSDFADFIKAHIFKTDNCYTYHRKRREMTL